MSTQITSNQIQLAYFFLSEPNQKNHFALGHSVLHKLEIVSLQLIFWSVAYDFLITCMDEKQTSSEGLKLKFG